MVKEFFQNPRAVLFVVLVITILSVAIDLPRVPVKFQFRNFSVDREIGGYQIDLLGGRITRSLEIKKGLDVAGGISVLLSADMSKIPEADRADALVSLKDVIERRVNLLGISEANIQTSQYGNEYRMIVELAGIFDPTQALETIGKVAQLEFRTEKLSAPVQTKDKDGKIVTEAQLPEYVATDLNGADLRKASVVVGQSANNVTGAPEIQLQFNAEGTKKFKRITEENVGRPVAIYLDNQILVNPTVQEPIANGRAVITGQFTPEQATALVAQLNAGALPVPVSVLKQQTVGPTLGQEAVRKSVFAGMIGLGLVIFFMIAYYRRLGVFASISLVIYGLITLALYKLVPVVLTLPGLTGFILSIGMAVDANILIFERIKEELRDKKPFSLAIENGFGRSWDAIRDANTTTLITAFILFNPFNWSFLPTSGLVRGFALTLALGIFISLFTGVFITRSLIRVLYRKGNK